MNVMRRRFTEEVPLSLVPDGSVNDKGEPQFSRRPLTTFVSLGEPEYMNERERLLQRIYDAFNRREIDTVLAAMHPAVDWPNGWEGGRVNGRDEVRSYWTRQWAAVDPMVVPVGFSEENDGRIRVRVHQTVKDLSGNMVAEGEVNHLYSFEDGLIKAMDIEP
jgi:nuclear transport factor 2 (NTF2) superfamily protein